MEHKSNLNNTLNNLVMSKRVKFFTKEKQSDEKLRTIDMNNLDLTYDIKAFVNTHKVENSAEKRQKVMHTKSLVPVTVYKFNQAFKKHLRRAQKKAELLKNSTISQNTIHPVWKKSKLITNKNK